MSTRNANIKRDTKETSIILSLNIDGTGESQISTGILFLDHMINQLAKHGRFDIKLSSTGNDEHHIVEDTAICLGKAFNQALGDKKGILRMAHAIVPMDESLALVALDISGRGFASIEMNFSHNIVSGMNADLIRHFLISFAMEAKINLHVKVLEGINDHHKAEATFKALAIALDNATKIDSRTTNTLPSTKDYLET